MIRAKLSGDGRTFTLELEGHANYARPGEDLVCAAVSTLAFAVDKYLDRLDKQGLLIEKQNTVMEKGRAKMTAVPEAQSREKFEGAFELAGCFLSILEENYPENLKISAKGQERKIYDRQA